MIFLIRNTMQEIFLVFSLLQTSLIYKVFHKIHQAMMRLVQLILFS